MLLYIAQILPNFFFNNTLKMIFALDLSSLNPQQREAVEWKDGPLMIFAGAGSGKTRAITYRIAKLIADGIPPWKILAVTFTNKAAKELEHRIGELAEVNVRKDMWVGTFHRLCAKLLRIDGKHIGISPSFVIYDDGDQVSLVRDIIKSKNIDEKTIQPRAVLSEISNAKEKLLSPEQYSQTATGYFEEICAGVYKVYQEKLHAASALDFDDIILYAVKLLEQRVDVRQKYQNKFEHILVDEFQDVNAAQFKLVHLLANDRTNITIVGDDDQSIYAWRGADVTLMLRFASEHPDVKVIKLEQNYRSTKTILDAAHNVIQHNRTRAEKKLWTDNEQGVPITVREAGTEQDEAMIVCDQILKDRRTGRRSLSDFAILYRTNAQSRVLEEALLTMRIPHILIGGQRFYERREIKDMIAYLRVVMNPRDDLSLLRILNVPKRAIGPKAIEPLSAWAADRSLSIWEAILDQANQTNMKPGTRVSFRSFVGLIQDAQTLAEQGSITEVLKHILQKSGYQEELRKEHTEESIGRLENLQELVNVTTQYDETSDTPSLSEFLESVTLISDVDALGDTSDAVTLMTLHSSKGLEFPVVFLVGMEEGVFPHSRSMHSDSELEEERRLCYVGITRAREELKMLFAQRRTVFGQQNFNRRSRFLDDIPLELLDGLPDHEQFGVPAVRANRAGQYSVTVPQAQQPAKPSWTPPFDIGTKVRHQKFGIGVVLACSPLRNDAEVTVAFPGVVGVKKLVQSLAKLETV